MMTSLPQFVEKLKSKERWLCESPFQMGSGADTNGCGLCRPPEPERVWVLGMKEVAFCPQPPPGSDHNSRNLIIVWVLYFSDELSSLLLLSTKLRINGRGLMVWNIQVSEWPCPNALCNAGLVELECRANICSRAIRGKKRTCVTWELIFDQIQAFRPVPPRVIWYCENRNKKRNMQNICSSSFVGYLFITVTEQHRLNESKRRRKGRPRVCLWQTSL